MKTNESDVRDAARREAQRRGVSLGEWLDEVMSAHAGTLGVAVSHLDPAQRVEAIMAQLAEAPPSQDGDPLNKLRTGEDPQGAASSTNRDAPQGGARPTGRSQMPTAAARLRDTFEDSDVAFLPYADMGETSSGPTLTTPQNNAAQVVEATALRKAAERSEIESKLNALFKALDRTTRRSENVAVAACCEEADGDDRISRKDALMGETAISPSWRFEKAVAEIAERQAFLESQAAIEERQKPRADTIKAGGPRAAADDIRRHFEPGDVDAVGSSGAALEAQRPGPARSVPSVFTGLQGDIARLAKRLDVVHRDVTHRAATNTGPAVDQVRAMLDGLRPDASIEALGRHVETLSAKLDTMIDQQVSIDAVDRLSHRIEAVHDELTARLSAQAASPAVDMAHMEGLIRDLVDQADRPAKAMPDLQGLESAVHELAVRLHHAERSSSDTAALADLQAQVNTLASHIDKSDAGLTAIVAMERSMSDIFAQLGNVRDASIQAAEAAARATARDMVQALPRAPSEGQGSDAIAEVRGELADLRAHRDEADQRLHSILMALNTSLERVVDRLGALEDEAEDVRHPGGSARVASRQAEEPTTGPHALDLNVQHPSRDVLHPSRQALDLDNPIEPGTVARERTVLTSPEVMPAVALSPAAPDPTSFIAAARRAAQSAAQEQAARLDEPAQGRTRAVPAAVEGQRGKRFKIGMLSRRRPLLLALAGLVLLMGAAQIVRLRMNGDALVPSAETTATTPGPDAPAPMQPAPKADADDATLDATAAGDQTPAPTAQPGEAAPVKPTASLTSPPDTNDVAAPPSRATSLPTMAMGPGASVAALKAADASARLATASADGAQAARSAADAGDARAQFETGLRAAEGRGMPRDMAAAAVWFEKAADQGLAPAAYRLGSLYEKGLGVARDAARAQSWYAKAADAGNVRAMHNLAVMLAEGATGKADYAAAGGWFTKAAEAGVRDSQFNLAILYARGLGVEQNLTKSYKWFALAALQGDTDSAKKRDDVAARLDATALADAQASVTAFKPTPALAAANDVAPPTAGWDANRMPAARANKPATVPNAHLSGL